MKTVKITKGAGGFGGPLFLKIQGEKNKLICVMGGGIHPVAQKLADMLGCEAIDGFKTGVPDSEIIAAVVDCGGTARCGVYPKKRIPTINIMPVGKSGPLAEFITEDIYVSDVSESCFSYDEGVELEAFEPENITKENIKEWIKEEKEVQRAKRAKHESNMDGINGILFMIGKSVGQVIGKFFQAARETIDGVIRNILPFMAFISLIIGIITGVGAGDFIANHIAPFAGSLPGLIGISVVCSIPFLSPVLGPGAVIAQIVGVLVGVQIGQGAIPVQYALPALFAIDAQVGCDFIPVGLSLGDAEPETIEIGVPAILFSRLITGPLSVIIAYIMSFGLYS